MPTQHTGRPIPRAQGIDETLDSPALPHLEATATLIGLALLLLLAGFTLYLDFRVRDAFEVRRCMPARLVCAPAETVSGLKLTPDALIQELARLGYKDRSSVDEPGRFARHGNRSRSCAAVVFWDGAQPARKTAPRFSRR